MKNVVELGEMMDYPGVINYNNKVLDKLVKSNENFIVVAINE